jgi:site-specific DNA-methyltransferase (adenine-specific)
MVTLLKGKVMINKGMYTSNSDEWATPQEFFDKLDEEFHFTLDPCATAENAKCKKFFTKDQDGLSQDWAGETVWCNPPYGKTIGQWCKKCYEHSLHGDVAVMLIHARTDTQWFHEWVYGKAELRFVKGRIRFNGSKWNAPFPSMVAIYR